MQGGVELREDLAASAARADRSIGIGRNGNTSEIAPASSHCISHGHALGAHRQAEAEIFNIAAGENRAIGTLERGANREIRIRRVGQCARCFGGLDKSDGVHTKQNRAGRSRRRFFSSVCGKTLGVVIGAKMKTQEADSLPTKAVLDEIKTFRRSFRQALDACAARMDENLGAVGAKVTAITASKKVPSGRGRDLRDMLTLLRGHKVNLEKGRLKDLKKLQGVAEDLAMLSEGWGK